jgi:hypothetical protein
MCGDSASAKVAGDPLRMRPTASKIAALRPPILAILKVRPSKTSSIRRRFSRLR